MSESALLQVAPPSPREVEAFLDGIRPGLLADGGNVELAGVDSDGTVCVEFQGECARCPAQLATLRVVLEEPLKRTHQGVTAVIAV